MASNLYEVLGIDKSASPEEIRKAYKKKALATHPDRLPQNVSEQEKQQANERFRLVNNAYEVLNDANNRKLYDQHGVWPPPTAVEEPPARGASAHDGFGGPYFDGDSFFPRHRPMRGFAFTDPFELFNSLFGDMHSAFHDDPFHNAFAAHSSPLDHMFGPSTLRSHSDFFGHSALSPFGMGFPFGGGHPLLDMVNGSMGNSGNVRSYSSVSQTVGSGGEWISQSTMTRTINGRTETITKRRDAQGNEHVTYSSPEGERYAINGVDQPAPNDRYLPQSGSQPAIASSSAAASAPSRHERSQAQPVPVGFRSSHGSSYAAPPQQEPSRLHHSSSRQRHHSTHEAFRPRDLEDDGIRRSSSSRQYTDSSRAAAYQDPNEYYNAPRRSTSSRHSRHSHHPHERTPYAASPQQEPMPSHGVGSGHRQPSTPYADPTPQDRGAKYNMDGHASHAYADPQQRSAYAHPPHRHHSHDREERHRHGDGERRDEHHRRKWWNGAHGWLSGLNKVFKWPQHHHHHEHGENGSSDSNLGTQASH